MPHARASEVSREAQKWPLHRYSRSHRLKYRGPISRYHKGSFTRTCHHVPIKSYLPQAPMITRSPNLIPFWSFLCTCKVTRHEAPLHKVSTKSCMQNLVFPEIFQAWAWVSYWQSRGCWLVRHHSMTPRVRCLAQSPRHRTFWVTEGESSSIAYHVEDHPVGQHLAQCYVSLPESLSSVATSFVRTRLHTELD